MSRVIIAEKPSMMKKYMKALSKEKDLKFTASVGHIEGLIPPEHYFTKEKIFWNELVKKFPFIPDNFLLEITNKEVYSKIISELKDAEEIILACDPDREGELIHRNIVDIAKKDGYVKTENITRVWLHAETEKGIQDGFNKRKNYIEYDGYYQAANTRMIIDWLLGIQLTVLYSVKFGKPGSPISIGRVQSWLLAEIVERYNQYINFVTEEYWKLLFTTNEGVKFNLVDKEGKQFDIKEEQIYKDIVKEIKEKDINITKIEKKKFTEYAPLLYDLSSLQKDAAKKYSISPEKTLELAQKLYEDYNLISYPRTDCNVISEEEAKQIKHSFELVERFDEYKFLTESVKKENPMFELNKKYIGEIKGHYAIIPVFSYDKKGIPNLKKDEKSIFDLIVKRFLAALLPPVKGEKSIINGTMFRENGEELLFLANIKNIREEGYKGYFKGDKDNEKEEDDVVSVDYKEGDNIKGKLSGKKEKTKPKELYSDNSIITLMEKAHLSVEDEKLRESLKDAKGIGTAATRASFIPILLKREYIVKENGKYIPTEKGIRVYKVLPNELKKADFSAKLEYELNNMVEKKGKTTADIVGEGKQFLQKVFSKINGNKMREKNYGVCPICKEPIVRGRSGWGCKNYTKTCTFYVPEEFHGAVISEKNMREIATDGVTSLIEGFNNKESVSSGYLRSVINEESIFHIEQEEYTSINCPICKDGIMENKINSYVCSKNCGFKISKIIAQKKIDIKDIRKLCNEGRTMEIKGFISKNTGKEFNSCLIIEDKKVEFYFGKKNLEKRRAEKIKNNSEIKDIPEKSE